MCVYTYIYIYIYTYTYMFTYIYIIIYTYIIHCLLGHAHCERVLEEGPKVPCLGLEMLCLKTCKHRKVPEALNPEP